MGKQSVSISCVIYLYIDTSKKKKTTSVEHKNFLAAIQGVMVTQLLSNVFFTDGLRDGNFWRSDDILIFKERRLFEMHISFLHASTYRS